jgi:hypothetical protein
MSRLLKTRPLVSFASMGLLALGLTCAGLYAYAGVYGFNVILRRGWSVWTTIAPDDPGLPAAVRLGLRDQPPAAKADPLVWQQIDQGFEVAELPVIADGAEVDRIFLARVDPHQFRFVVRNAAAGNKEVGDWMDELGAVLVINGSYFSQQGTPDTPFLSAGVLLGPSKYEAKHGAFVASYESAKIYDLSHEDWRSVFRGAHDALVSYPLLIAEDGTSRVSADPHWLANRSFVAQDPAGNIILGTTKEAFFSLERLAAFLRAAPLGLTIALNLDGGPVACQAIALNDFRRDFCGDWELATHEGKLKVLTQFGHKRWTLPIVLAVLRK